MKNSSSSALVLERPKEDQTVTVSLQPQDAGNAGSHLGQ